MAFKGVTQRWRKMLAKNVFALNGLFVGGTAAANKLTKAVNATASIGATMITVTSTEQYKMTASVPGAVLGDYVMVNLTEDQKLLTSGGYVNTAGQVTVLLGNHSGAGVTVGTDAGIKILVLKS